MELFSHPYDNTIVCPLCLDENRPALTNFDLQKMLYECLLHGPVLTQQRLEGRSDSLGEWWRWPIVG